MNCQVCLSEEKAEKESYLLRIFDLDPSKIEEKLRGFSFELRVSLSGVEVKFESGDEWKKAKEILRNFVYSDKGEPMEKVVGDLLKEKRLTLSTAESCTAGLLSARIVNVPGSSEYFLGGVVVYSNELKKELLGVREETLERFGAVSKETCTEMLRGLRDRFKTDCGIAITGIAGPGGSERKPEGLTYIGVYVGDREVIEERVFNMGRNPNRFLSTQVGLNILRKMVVEEQ